MLKSFPCENFAKTEQEKDLENSKNKMLLETVIYSEKQITKQYNVSKRRNKHFPFGYQPMLSLLSEEPPHPMRPSLHFQFFLFLSPSHTSKRKGNFEPGHASQPCQHDRD